LPEGALAIGGGDDRRVLVRLVAIEVDRDEDERPAAPQHAVQLAHRQSSKIRSGAKWRTRIRSVTVFATGTQKRAFCAVGDLCRFITDYLSCVRGAS
jgi:hypothetical protein